MPKLTDPKMALKLARALVSDVLLYNEKEVARSREKRKIIRPLRDAIAEATQLYQSRVDTSVPECAACFDRAVAELLKIPPGDPEPQSSAPVVTPDAPAPAPLGPLDPTVASEILAALDDPGAGPRQIEQLAARHAGKTLSDTLVVERVALTTESGLPEQVRYGRTVIGTLPEGLRVAVAFPKSEDETLQSLGTGEAFRFQGAVVAWDPLFRQLVLAATRSED